MSGTVQGVGFRPFVYRTARGLGLTGIVLNTPEGVAIEVQGAKAAREAFEKTLHSDLPPLARIHAIALQELSPRAEEDFRIVPSQVVGGATAEVSPDIAPCEDCLRELLDPADRRHGYPFINCTNCGPRYTIVESIPYDRAQTTMRPFAMCGPCAREYTDPADRRFHAEPTACAACGPKLSFVRSDDRAIGRSRPPSGRSGHPLQEALAALAAGEIVAIKGAGGFHLACDAGSERAVRELRRRKGRDEKPFAIMAGDLEGARALCHISEIEEKLLTSPQRPIVLLRKRDSVPVAPSVAPGNQNLGVMLPSTPLHHLLLFGKTGHKTPDVSLASRVSRLASAVGPLVMTSGNKSDEPIATSNDDALERLSSIADAFLLHDRAIRTRVDDSVLRAAGDRPALIRRARGFVPEPLRLPFETPRILAAGADLKGAICLTRARSAYLSQHLGDLENALAHRAFEEAIAHLQRLLEIQPELVACDLHPDYFSSRHAAQIAQSRDLPIVRVQHHHAHIASCMAENGLPNETVIGVALDGAGFGPDGTIWGGEILLADYAGYKRAARFRSLPMPGGDAAAREPWRMAIACLVQSPDPPTSPEIHRLLPEIDPRNIDLVAEMAKRSIRSPMTSSAGRLFDAVAALAGVRLVNTFEGQAAMELEGIADEEEKAAYSFELQDAGHETRDARLQTSVSRLETRDSRLQHQPLMEIDFRKTIEEIVSDRRDKIPAGTISAKFHNTLASALVSACLRLKVQDFGLVSRVCLSGGCFQNTRLSEGLKKRLEADSFQVYTHSLAPPNDGGIALGQAAVAAHTKEFISHSTSDFGSWPATASFDELKTPSDFAKKCWA